MLAQMAAEASGTLDPCCAAIVAMLTQISTTLTTVVTGGGGGTGTPISSPDLDAITTALQGIKADLDTLAESSAPATNALATVIAPLLAPLAAAATMLTTPVMPAPVVPKYDLTFVDALLEQMATDGRLASGDEQLITSGGTT